MGTLRASSVAAISCAVAVAVAGCGGATGAAPVASTGGGSQGSAVPGAAPAPGVAAFGPQAPVATPGESMSYRLSLHGLEIATFVIAVGEVVELDGARVIGVESGVTSVGLAALFAKVQDRFTSFVDAATTRPVRFRSEELSSAAEPIPETADVAFAAAADGTFPVRVGRPDVAETVELQALSDAPLYCLNGFLLALRGWDGELGDRAAIDVVRSRYLWRTDVTFAAFESVVTVLGEVPAVRIDGVSRRINRDGSTDTSIGERRYTMWISDDADRVPVRMVAKTDFGDLEMALATYQPGRGVPLRR